VEVLAEKKHRPEIEFREQPAHEQHWNKTQKATHAGNVSPARGAIANPSHVDDNCHGLDIIMLFGRTPV
jgi:hypothetical protein